jgi:hypothetical protein
LKRTNSIRYTLVACLALFGLALGCDDDDDDTGGPPSTDGPEFQGEEDYHEGVGTELGALYQGDDTLILDQSHDGWKNPNCWLCHPNAVQQPGKCRVCHGIKGAPIQPVKHKHDPALFGVCSACHWPLRYVHEGMTDYFDFDDCGNCHFLE